MPEDSTRPSILIVTSSTGGGHINMSAALGEMLDESFDITIVNAHPPIVSSFYSFASRYAVTAWSKVMKITDTGAGARGMHTILYALIRRRLTSIIRDAAPDLIITTHSMLSYEITRLLAALDQRIPVVFQVTDLTLHHMWVTEKRASAYLASTREIYEGLIAAGVERDRVVLTGRPVRRQFLDDYSARRAHILRSLGLDPSQFTAYVQGGAEGSAQIVRTIYALLDAHPEIQCVVAAGHNEEIRRRVSTLGRVAALPYTALIAPYMAACDVVVGKPGAGSVGEAIVLGKPFIASTVIPYQETPNVDFIERHGLGWRCLEPGSLTALIQRLLSDRTLLAEKTRAIQTYAAFNLAASRRLAPLIGDLLAQNETQNVEQSEQQGQALTAAHDATMG
ncbi:MAG TPA: glycosyltransferase [Ktedonobacterales bacterium]|nr:glycosyltransferase [Ktedonobacterales bacterium]